ncbi:MAG: type III-A CRISPR-associated protein Cas10/Csm1, partial [Breznakiellaceae bacterium]
MGNTALDLDSITYEEIVLAALLHDIGKIAQRAEDKSCELTEMEGQILPKAHNGEYYTHRHALYTFGALEKLCKEIGKYLNIRPNIVSKVAARHHAPSHWAEHIIAISDRLSSGADRKENEGDTTQTQKGSYFERAQNQSLQSVFSSVSINSKTAEKTFYKAAPLSRNASYPVIQAKNGKDIYSYIWEGLQKSIYAIQEKDFNHYLAALDAALEHWTWAVPSSTIDQPDISLYDHAKTTAAFATALFTWYKEQQENIKIDQLPDNKKIYGLITGDVSGIQDYLFDLRTDYRSTKILRARSFEIRAVTDSVAQYILEKFHLNRFCVLSSAGGRFTILLPNLKNAASLMEEIREEIDVFFIKRYMGSLAICISDIQECAKSDFLIENNNFRNTFVELQKKSNLSKQKKLQRGIIKKGHIIGDYYENIT